MSSVLTRLAGFFVLVSDVVVLTIAFWCGVALGLVALGVAPSLAALVWTADRRFVDGSAQTVWRLFWRRYFTHFRPALRAHLVPLIIVAFLLADFALVSAVVVDPARTPLLVLTGVASAVAGLAVVHGLRAGPREEEPSFINSLAFTVRRPWHNLAFATVTFLLLRVAALVTGFALLLLPGLWAWLISVVGRRLDAAAGGELR
ncbi:YesL family protein [Oerskovia flava]|uniref:YesL family protein n=1 Tax=Oerskovia flava TaxID=2986422 RepID=UPI00223FBC43|nr:YesL family protein [Oerskovia sp. JB1-3-2]